MTAEDIQGFRLYQKKLESQSNRIMPDDPKQEKDAYWAQQWRKKIISEIANRVAKIQDPIWTEPQVRELNDEINKYLRQKTAWERRIRELGGPDYLSSSKSLQKEGAEISGTTGYRYFGRAKDLPGVRELLEQEAKEKVKPKKTRADLIRQVDLDYYGYRDEDDDALLEFEQEYDKDRVFDDSHQDFVDHIPTQDEIQQLLLERRKKQLLERYVKS